MLIYGGNQSMSAHLIDGVQRHVLTDVPSVTAGVPIPFSLLPSRHSTELHSNRVTGGLFWQVWAERYEC